MQKSSVYITTAIPYANAAPHIGFAMEAVQADALRRFFALQGHATFLLTGTDVHGQKMLRTAEANGTTPEKFAAEMTEKFRSLKATLDLSNDDFVATYEPRHHTAAKKIWQLCDHDGDIYIKKYAGLYCVGCERFYIEKELENGICPIHKKPAELLEEENYFFKLSKYTAQVKELLETDRVAVRPISRKNEILALVERGLEDVSISRPKGKLPWGIDVPTDPGHVMYVWFDALTNYLTGIGWPEDGVKFKTWWPTKGDVNPRAIHVIGKDILRQHAALWIGMLLSAGVEPPTDIFVHGFVTVEGEKMSKSLGNVLEPEALVEKYAAKIPLPPDEARATAIDVLRYYVLRDIPSNEDGDFSEARLEERYTKELAHDLGNLVSRVAMMVSKFGKIDSSGTVDEKIAAVDFTPSIESYELHTTISILWGIVQHTNQLIDSYAPWTMAKNNDPKLPQALGHVVKNVRWIGANLQPYMPSVSAKIVAAFASDKIKPVAPLFPPLSS